MPLHGKQRVWFLEIKTDQDATAWETEGLVLTDVGSTKSNYLIFLQII